MTKARSLKWNTVVGCTKIQNLENGVTAVDLLHVLHSAVTIGVPLYCLLREVKLSNFRIDKQRIINPIGHRGFGLTCDVHMGYVNRSKTTKRTKRSRR